jgi:hypothetical protein
MVVCTNGMRVRLAGSGARAAKERGVTRAATPASPTSRSTYSYPILSAEKG